MVKKVVLTKGKFKDYWNEIQQSYELGCTPYRLHTNVDDTFVTPTRYYDGKVYVLDDVATMGIGDWYREMDTTVVNLTPYFPMFMRKIMHKLGQIKLILRIA